MRASGRDKAKPGSPGNSPGLPSDLAPLAGGLLPGAGHALRNRLTGLSYAAEAARSELEEDDPKRALHFIHQLQSGLDLAHQQLSDLLFAQHILNDGGCRVSTEPVEIRRLVERAILRIRPSEHRSRVEAGLEGLAVANLDPGLADRILDHLVGNALRFSDPPGAVEVRWRQSRDGACIEICDRGIGIPKRDLPRLFRPYARGGNAGSRAGLGLGLFIARSAAKALRGSLDLMERPGGGTVARLELPA